MMVVEDELRQVTKNNVKTGVPEDASVGNLHLADAQGIITCSLWRKSRRRPLRRIAEKSGTRHCALLSADALENHTGQSTLFDAPEEAEQH